jgi:WD40 repeat protein
MFCGPKNFFVITDFGLRLKMFNLDEIEFSPKFIKNTSSIPVLSPDGRFFALVIDRTDIGIVDTCDMTMVRRFSVGSVSTLVWTGDSSGVNAFETGLGNRISLVYIEEGTLKSSHAISSPESQVGVRCVESNPFYLVLGYFNEKVSIYDIRTGLDLIAHISLASSHLVVVDDCPRVFRESLGGDASVRDRNLFQLGGRNELGFPVEYREVVPDDTLVESVKRIEIPSTSGVTTLTNAGPSRGGVCDMRLSPDGAWLAVQTDEKASIVFIIDLTRVRVTNVLVHRQPVRCFSWNPRPTGEAAVLAIALGDCRVHLWEPTSNSHICIELTEKNFDALSALWSSTGEYIVVESEHAVCCVSVEPHLEPIGG